MPIIELENINSNGAWALWEIDEAEGDLRELLSLVPEEEAALATIGHPTKRLEWLAGRAAAQALTTYLGGCYVGIAKDGFGKPHLKDNSQHVSLTNTHPYAAALVCEGFPAGIDLEQPREKLLRLAPKFMAPDELQHAGQRVDYLCLYWAAKEALYKRHGRKQLSFKEQLLIAPFELEEAGTLKGVIKEDYMEEAVDMAYRCIHGHTLCYTIN